MILSLIGYEQLKLWALERVCGLYARPIVFLGFAVWTNLMGLA